MLFDFNNLLIKYNIKIDGIIHIGAHYGEEINLYLKENINNIICFEPLISNFSILENNAMDRCDLFNLALGNENKKIKMYVDSENNGQSSSILKPYLHLTECPTITFNKINEVQMMRLDDFMIFYFSNSKNKTKKFNLINIDVQGYELEVFKGSENTLENIDYIITEINRDYLYEECVLVDELDNYLNKFKFNRVETNWAGNTWGDALYIKN